MGRFVKKPIAIEAVQWVPAEKIEWPLWASEAWSRGSFVSGTSTLADAVGAIWRAQDDGLCIGTREGVMRAEPGDWIIQGIKGELYPCKPDIFEATYTVVS